MRIGIMQPYFFPYLGYYQLASHVDQFVFLDDVQMIRRGYIQRNYISLHGTPHRFNLPIKQCSQNKLINQHTFLENHEDFLRLLHNAYHQAPYFNIVHSLIKKILREHSNVAECCAASIYSVFSYLEIPLSYAFSSSHPSQMKSQDRILELCNIFNADTYFNPIGGKELYDTDEFRQKSVQLFFFEGSFPLYKQNSAKSSTEFIPKLSMIDILMHASKEEVKQMLCMGHSKA